MTLIRCITFDWGDTLAANVGMPYVSTQRRCLATLAARLTSLGCTPPPDWVAQAMRDLEEAWSSSADPIRNPEHREADFQGLIDRWLGRADALSADASAVHLAVDRFLSDLTDVIPAYADAAPTLSLLKARSFRIGILSHVPWPGPGCRAWFVRWGLAPYIDFYSLSSEIGWIKPNPRHFQHALDHAGCPPAQVLHVGDHPLRDIQGARAMGMRTCLRLTEGVYDTELIEACHPEATIDRIGQVPALVALLNAPTGTTR